MSLMFPTIYGIALDAMTEEESKLGSAFLIMSIVGGALLTKLQGGLIDSYSGSHFVLVASYLFCADCDLWLPYVRQFEREAAISS